MPCILKPKTYPNIINCQQQNLPNVADVLSFFFFFSEESSGAGGKVLCTLDHGYVILEPHYVWSQFLPSLHFIMDIILAIDECWSSFWPCLRKILHLIMIMIFKILIWFLWNDVSFHSFCAKYECHVGLDFGDHLWTWIMELLEPCGLYSRQIGKACAKWA